MVDLTAEPHFGAGKDLFPKTATPSSMAISSDNE